MPCKPGIPGLEPPALPSPFTIPEPPLPKVPDPSLCCKLPPFPFDLDLPPLPPIGPDVMAIIREGIDEVLKHLDSFPLKCPRE